MLTGHYIPLAVKWLITIACVALGFFTFGIPLLFDGITAIFYIFIAYSFRNDMNVVGMCILLISYNIFLDLIFTFSQNNLYWLLFGYGFGIYALAKCRLDAYTSPAGVLTLTCLGFEVYWYLNSIDGPEIYYYVLTIGAFLLMRLRLMVRSDDSRYLFDVEAETLTMDHKVSKLFGISIIVVMMMIIEYLLRRSGITDSTVIHYNYKFIMHGISAWIVWTVIFESMDAYQNKTVLT